MKLNLLALACALAVSFGLSMGSFAGAVADADSDGIPDSFDNCTTVANGPLLGTCTTNQDADTDGLGNACDADFDQTGTVASNDLVLVLNAQNTVNDVLDIDCSGTVASSDLVFTLNNQNTAPGPSGLGCADPVNGAGTCPPI